MQGMSWSITSSYDGRNGYERLSNATETFLSASAGEGELLRHARKHYHTRKLAAADITSGKRRFRAQLTFVWLFRS